MEPKLNCILLIDDDKATNFLHKRIVQNSGCAKECIAVEGGEEALAFLRSKQEGKHPQPDLIFLDINMPGMNGWEFLEAYKKLNVEQQGKIVLVMITTSLNPDDEEKANKIEKITNFVQKPLSVKMINQLLEEHQFNVGDEVV